MALQFNRDRILWKEEGSGLIGHFRVTSGKPLFQGVAKRKAVGMKMIFYSHANKTNFHEKVFSLLFYIRVAVILVKDCEIFWKQC